MKVKRKGDGIMFSQYDVRWTLAIFSACSLWLFLSSCVQPPEVESSSEGNRNPQFRGLTANPPSIKAGTWTTITADAVDPDGDPVTFSWTATAGDFVGEGPSVRYTATYCCLGFNSITVTVKDNRGGRSSAVIDVEVQR